MANMEAELSTVLVGIFIVTEPTLKSRYIGQELVYKKLLKDAGFRDVFCNFIAVINREYQMFNKKTDPNEQLNMFKEPSMQMVRRAYRKYADPTGIISSIR